MSTPKQPGKAAQGGAIIVECWPRRRQPLVRCNPNGNIYIFLNRKDFKTMQARALAAECSCPASYAKKLLLAAIESEQAPVPQDSKPKATRQSKIPLAA